MTTVALIGPDGAGKTTIARSLANRLGPSAAYLYMGINLEASNVMMPTTRLVLELKRRLGGRPDLAVWRDEPEPREARGGVRRAVKTTARIANQMMEEWFRQLIAWYQQRRGRMVVFDRHFYLDYHAYDVAARHRRDQPLARRLHGLMLDRLYPKPDLVVMLDAPAELLLERKGEGTVESIERRRREYLALRDHVRRFEIVDATRPISVVLDDLVALVCSARDDKGTA